MEKYIYDISNEKEKEICEKLENLVKKFPQIDIFYFSAIGENYVYVKPASVFKNKEFLAEIKKIKNVNFSKKFVYIDCMYPIAEFSGKKNKI